LVDIADMELWYICTDTVDSYEILDGEAKNEEAMV
jgi:hypothetical protein